jgi:hypothetical protein
MIKRITTTLAILLMISLFVSERTSARKNSPNANKDAVKKAVEKGLPLLESIRVPFLEKTGCFSCHHNFMPAMASGLARERGFKVNEKTALEESEMILSIVKDGREKLLQGDGFGGAQFTAALALLSLSANKQTPNKTTDALVHYLLSRQNVDGRWMTQLSRPPSESSDITGTAVSVRALQLFVPKGLRPEMETRIERARAWLLKAAPRNNEDWTFKLLGLAWTNAEKQTIRKLSEALLAQQRKDGGWGQYPTMASDAYATGQALVALHQASKLPVIDPAYQQGVSYLLDRQAADGSWAVKTRTLPLQKYFESGFPHGEDQWISAAASSWATMALILTVDAPANSVSYLK